MTSGGGASRGTPWKSPLPDSISASSCSARRHRLAREQPDSAALYETVVGVVPRPGMARSSVSAFFQSLLA